MSTAAQLTANQINAQSSTGPRTEAGKAASSRNNFRHGLASSQLIIPGENPEEFEELLASFQTEHAPSTPTEQALIHKMAEHLWLSQRALSFQSLCFTGPEVDQKQLALYLRYQSTHDRAFHKSLNDLLKLRKERRQEQIGFDSQKLKALEELRRQELHEAKIRSLHAKAEHLEIDSDIRQTIEAPLPGNLRIPFDIMKKVFEAAVREVSKES
jgi:hypothetical protein